MKDYLNVTIWANYYCWPIKTNNFLLLNLLKDIVSLAYFQAQNELRTKFDRYNSSNIFVGVVTLL